MNNKQWILSKIPVNELSSNNFEDLKGVLLIDIFDQFIWKA